MTCRQMALVITVSALVSAMISAGVALLVIRSTQPESAVTQLIVASPTAFVPEGDAPTALPMPGPTSEGAAEQPIATSSVPAEAPTSEAAGAAPSATPIVHIVQPGEMLSSLALEYGVPEADIIAANQIGNPDFLPAGAEILIPVGGVPGVTPTWTAIPTATSTPIPFEPPSAQLTATVVTPLDSTATARPTALTMASGFRLEISEIAGVGNVGQEAVFIVNVGELLADMAGWTLSDADGNTYVFPNYRLWPAGNVVVNSRIGQDGSPVSSLFWGRSEPVWSPGEVATVRNAVGELVTTYVVGP
jgi:LysM repeat protein